MKMTFIISLLIFFASACKSDNNISTSSKKVMVKEETVTSVNSTKDTIEKETAEGPIKVTTETKVATQNKTKVEKVKVIGQQKKETATKSVPKPEIEEAKEKLEEVKHDKNKVKEGKDKSVPKPEIKENKEALEQVDIKKKVEAEKPKFMISHDKFDALLSKYVSSNGDVDYKGLKNDVSKLQVYLNELTSIQLASLSKNEKLAFWINAYNAYTIKLIIDNYPVNSITDLEGGKPWDKKWIMLDGKTLSLNNIENDIIRPQFNEPRIHFAVNCAAKSCPPLLNKAWTASNLESNFVTQTKKFINNPQFNKVTEKSIEISKIFEWYGEDFGDIFTFFNKYSDTNVSPSAEKKFLEYNWALNKQ
jgi:hypothetical protein